MNPVSQNLSFNDPLSLLDLSYKEEVESKLHSESIEAFFSQNERDERIIEICKVAMADLVETSYGPKTFYGSKSELLSDLSKKIMKQAYFERGISEGQEKEKTFQESINTSLELINEMSVREEGEALNNFMEIAVSKQDFITAEKALSSIKNIERLSAAKDYIARAKAIAEGQILNPIHPELNRNQQPNNYRNRQANNCCTIL